MKSLWLVLLIFLSLPSPGQVTSRQSGISLGINCGGLAPKIIDWKYRIETKLESGIDVQTHYRWTNDRRRTKQWSLGYSYQGFKFKAAEGNIYENGLYDNVTIDLHALSISYLAFKQFGNKERKLDPHLFWGVKSFMNVYQVSNGSMQNTIPKLRISPEGAHIKGTERETVVLSDSQKKSILPVYFLPSFGFSLEKPFSKGSLNFDLGIGYSFLPVYHSYLRPRFIGKRIDFSAGLRWMFDMEEPEVRSKLKK